jgi:hypothetical protein
METRKETHACRVLLGKETEETTPTRTRKIETRKPTSLVSLQMLETAADFLLGPRERFPEYDEWLAIEKAEKEQH